MKKVASPSRTREKMIFQLEHGLVGRVCHRPSAGVLVPPRFTASISYPNDGCANEQQIDGSCYTCSLQLITADDAIHVLHVHQITYLVFYVRPRFATGFHHQLHCSAALSRQQPLIHPHQHARAMRRNTGDKMNTRQIKGLLLLAAARPRESAAKPGTIQGDETAN